MHPDSDIYKIDGSFSLGGDATIANGGVSGNHPYLADTTLPAYVGAINPSDGAWVDGVKSMDVAYFTSQETGSTPTWIEGVSSDPKIIQSDTGVTIIKGTGVNIIGL